MRRLLVTGSAGHLGEALMRVCRSRGIDAIGCDIKPSPFTDAVGDLRDERFVRTLFDGVSHVLHTATLHKPHVITHSRQDFIDTNITATQSLLSAAIAAKVDAFVFTSTTSTFGDAMKPGPDAPAVWVDEALPPIPKNIYGITKLAAEDLCALAARLDRLPCVVLRTSRFFPEDDDDKAQRDRFDQDNLKLVELLYRRVDLEDCVDAHFLALERAPAVGFGRFIVSAPSPFSRADAARLMQDAAALIRERFPVDAVLSSRGWTLPTQIDRIYDSGRARAVLGWQPRHTFDRVLARVAAGGTVGSDLARAVGAKGYHDRTFEDGPFPVAC